MISCMSLPPVTISSVPIFDFAIANEELAIISAAVRAFVEDACILSKSLETLGHVRQNS